MALIARVATGGPGRRKAQTMAAPDISGKTFWLYFDWAALFHNIPSATVHITAQDVNGEFDGEYSATGGGSQAVKGLIERQGGALFNGTRITFTAIENGDDRRAEFSGAITGVGHGHAFIAGTYSILSLIVPVMTGPFPFCGQEASEE
jgi:hypothetical protein